MLVLTTAWCWCACAYVVLYGGGLIVVDLGRVFGLPAARCASAPMKINKVEIPVVDKLSKKKLELNPDGSPSDVPPSEKKKKREEVKPVIKSLETAASGPRLLKQ